MKAVKISRPSPLIDIGRAFNQSALLKFDTPHFESGKEIRSPCILLHKYTNLRKLYVRNFYNFKIICRFLMDFAIISEY